MNGEDLNRENCRCYVDDECFETYLFNPSNILIIKNVTIGCSDDAKKDGVEYSPVIVRFCMNTSIGCPMKVFITKTTTVEMIVEYFVSKMDDKFIFFSCLSENRRLNLCDIVLQTDDHVPLMKLLIKLK